MSRSLSILLVLLLLGLGGGFFLHQSQKPSAPKPAPAPQTSDKVDANASSTVALMNPNAPQTSSSAPAGDQQIGILQAQVEYLQGQMQALQEENSQLIDKLASLTGTKPVMPQTSPPPSGCEPARLNPESDAPDFVGIGIDLLKIRSLQDIPVPTISVSYEEVEKHIAQWLSTQFAPDHGQKQGRALAALGAIPDPVDTIALKASFLSHQIGSWYDEKAQTLFMAQKGEMLGPKLENALGLSYGYLFKHFSKDLFPAKIESLTLDARFAKETLLAGDASLVRFLHALKNPGVGGGGGVGEDPDDPSRMVPIPNFLRELELQSFSVGFDFMQAMHSIGEWDQVNAIYKRPPIAGAELLDAQIYLQETPFALQPIEIPDTNLEGKTPFWQDTLGPVAIMLFLKQHVAAPIAADTTPGWSNDKLLAYEAGEGKRDHAVWQTLWKSTDAADAFFGALRDGLLSKYKGAKPLPNVPQGQFQLHEGGRFILLQRTNKGSGVIYIDAADEKFSAAALQKFATKS